MDQTVPSDYQTTFAVGFAARSRTDPMENSPAGLEPRHMGTANQSPNLVETVVDQSRIAARFHRGCESKDSSEHTDQTSLPPGARLRRFGIATLNHILKAI